MRGAIIAAISLLPLLLRRGASVRNSSIQQDVPTEQGPSPPGLIDGATALTQDIIDIGGSLTTDADGSKSELPGSRDDEEDDDEHMEECKDFLKDEGFKVVTTGGYGTMIFMSVVGGICIIVIIWYGVGKCLEHQFGDWEQVQALL